MCQSKTCHKCRQSEATPKKQFKFKCLKCNEESNSNDELSAMDSKHRFKQWGSNPKNNIVLTNSEESEIVSKSNTFTPTVSKNDSRQYNCH